MHVYVCIYIYTYIHIHTYNYLHMHIDDEPVPNDIRELFLYILYMIICIYLIILTRLYT